MGRRKKAANEGTPKTVTPQHSGAKQKVLSKPSSKQPVPKLPVPKQPVPKLPLPKTPLPKPPVPKHPAPKQPVSKPPIPKQAPLSPQSTRPKLITGQSFDPLHYLIEQELLVIDRQFATALEGEDVVLFWTGVDFHNAQKWAKIWKLKTLTMAMGPLMDPANPNSPKAQKGSKAYSRYVKGASGRFAQYACQHCRVIVLTNPPPNTYSSRENNTFEQLEEPILKGLKGDTPVRRIDYVHPTVDGAAHVTYEVWPCDKTQDWANSFGGRCVKSWRKLNWSYKSLITTSKLELKPPEDQVRRAVSNLHVPPPLSSSQQNHTAVGFISDFSVLPETAFIDPTVKHGSADSGNIMPPHQNIEISEEISPPMAVSIRDAGNSLPIPELRRGRDQMDSAISLPTRLTPDTDNPFRSSSLARRHRHARSSKDLRHEHCSPPANFIRGHESRTSDMPFKYGMREEQPIGQVNAPYLDGMSQIFDFHEMSLFLEVDCPGGVQVTVLQCSAPQNSEANRVVEVDKIEPGKAIEIDSVEDLFGPRVLFLTKRDSKGINQWWECRWNNGYGHTERYQKALDNLKEEQKARATDKEKYREIIDSKYTEIAGVKKTEVERSDKMDGQDGQVEFANRLNVRSIAAKPVLILPKT